ncbi:linker for activation of T-cells family member 1 [Bombina bombina]|uniref:linker for activation of T-cells family member 1 n=1 Tax=Bombina bombina TaxID=8345 RepID=UPI00235A8512|nr:linker for activation of T-cells family member 1 [Bombina bombina]
MNPHHKQQPKYSGIMDSLNVTMVLWAFVFILPVIVTTALCISCRKRTPTRIAQSVDEYTYKPTFTSPPSSSFIVLGTHQSLSSPTIISSQDQFLSIPRSPAQAESRRSSVGIMVKDTDSLPSYENEIKTKDNDDEDDDDGNYSNDNYIGGYITVLPDEVDVAPCSGLTVPLSLDNSASVSSATIADDYENVEKSRDSMGESLEYVNMPSMAEAGKQHDAFIVVAEYQSGQESEDDTNDYENVEKKLPA